MSVSRTVPRNTLDIDRKRYAVGRMVIMIVFLGVYLIACGPQDTATTTPTLESSPDVTTNTEPFPETPPAEPLPTSPPAPSPDDTGMQTPADDAIISNDTNIEAAREALMDYFVALEDGRYQDALEYYGGSFDILHNWFPIIDPDDHVALFAEGCKGLLYCRTIRQVVSEEQLAPTEYRFVVEFVGADGGTFVLTVPGFDPRSEYTYTVIQQNGQWLVQELPPTLP